MLISFIPLAALLYFLVTNLSSQLINKERIETVYIEVKNAEALSNLIHEIQQERGYSLGYLLSSGREEKAELLSQRQQVDKTITLLNQTKAAGNKLDVQQISDKLKVLRTEINQLQVDPDTIHIFLSQLILSLIDDVNKTAYISRNPEVKNLLHAHMFLMYGKEYFGEVRANMKQMLLSNGFKGNGFARFCDVKAKYEMNLDHFRKNTSPALAAAYSRKMESPAVLKVREIIDAAYNQPAFSKFSFTINDWWMNGVAFLNILKEVEDLSSAAISDTAERELALIRNNMIRSMLIASAVIILILFLLITTIKLITGSITEIKEAADRVAKGDLDKPVLWDSKDEVGILADSFNKLMQVSKEYALVADTIGKGDYSPVVQIRSNTDTLGISLNNMKNNLRSLSEENEKRNWLLNGNSEINDRIRGDKEVRGLADEVITQMTKYMSAQIGAIFLAENGHLNLTGSYAFHHRKENSNVIKLGQGLVGQAALEKKPIIFSEVPDDYLKINSGLGSVVPRNIIVYPFQYDGQLKGVIEIGAAKEFSELDLEFMNLVTENIGIAFNSTQSREKLKELLEETQRQAEEMEAQQEELRQINEELQEKTNLLQNSEAELKAQQEELQQTNEELEEKANLLEEQKEKLEVSKLDVETKARQLEINSKYKSEFLANMSHELRTPLNSILILAQLLAENKNNVLGSKEVEFARNINSSGTDLLNLINEILDLSKVESGKIELELSQVQLPEIVENLHSMFDEVAKNKTHGFEINLNKNQFKQPLTTDKQRLEQILRNLLSNAFKFTGKGGKVTLDIELISPNSMSVRNKKLRSLNKLVAFTVSDTGIGIAPGKQSVIFEAFQQADGSTKRKYGGTGLGLSISRELALALGGEIHLQSEEGKGSRFTLILPLQYDPSIILPLEKEVSVKAPEETIEEEVGEEKNKVENINVSENISDDRYSIQENDKVILVVEDDITFATIILNFVREKGYKGILAHQGNVGLSLARHYRPDAIILDMKLPVMDGSEVLRHLKNDPDLRHIPVQIISGYDTRKQGFELGAFDFMMKPLSQTDLNAAFIRIEDFISRKLKKLLVVEDNKQQNLAIRELTGNADIRSFSAYTGEEAIRLMSKESFDCVIIDLGLPDMGGIELLEKIKADNKLNKVPVIVYTGKDLSKEETSRLNKLANTIVLKTADSNERLLDETVLFLHQVESKLPKEKQQIIRKLHRSDEVLRNKKVLLVDDDIRNIYSLTNVLEEEGVKCITAENGKAAIKTLKEQPDTDIVLMDVMMPEMDGYEATREIRKITRYSKLPIIALTAKAMKGDREKCLEAGMSDYIAKPVKIDQLLSLMRVWLYR